MDKTSYEKPEGWLAFNHSPARGLSIEGRRACESAGRCPSQRWTVNPIRQMFEIDRGAQLIISPKAARLVVDGQPPTRAAVSHDGCHQAKARRR